jgi:hypothetical protein
MEEQVGVEPELISDTVQDNLTRALLSLPATLGLWAVGKITGFVEWIKGRVLGFADFFADPGTKIRTGWSKFRQEMDALSTAQLVAVLFTFTLFLILPLLSVVLFSLENFPYHFVSLFQDSNFWPWQYNNHRWRLGGIAGVGLWCCHQLNLYGNHRYGLLCIDRGVFCVHSGKVRFPWEAHYPDGANLPDTGYAIRGCHWYQVLLGSGGIHQ